MDHEVPTEGASQRSRQVSEDQADGSAEILSRLGICGGWDGAGSYTSAHGDPPKICGKQGGGDAENEYKPSTQGTIQISE